tara:strand:- start:6085 stop:6201 length:117 start_codon:yes stop_codon:yes gene_type:complete
MFEFFFGVFIGVFIAQEIENIPNFKSIFVKLLPKNNKP